MSIGLLVREKKGKIDFQDGCHGGHLGFTIGTILADFDLQVTSILPTKFQVKWHFVSGEEAKIDFHNGCHGGRLGFPIGTILARRGSLLKQIVDDARRTTDIDRSQ